jgi:hypothetical protein
VIGYLLAVAATGINQVSDSKRFVCHGKHSFVVSQFLYMGPGSPSIFFQSYQYTRFAA